MCYKPHVLVEHLFGNAWNGWRKRRTWWLSNLNRVLDRDTEHYVINVVGGGIGCFTENQLSCRLIQPSFLQESNKTKIKLRDKSYCVKSKTENSCLLAYMCYEPCTKLRTILQLRAWWSLIWHGMLFSNSLNTTKTVTQCI